MITSQSNYVVVLKNSFCKLEEFEFDYLDDAKKCYDKMNSAETTTQLIDTEIGIILTK